MHLSVIIVVVFLSTSSTFTKHHLKRRLRNDQRLGIISSKTTNTKLYPMEHQSLKKETKKVKAIGNGQQHQNKIPMLYRKMLKIIKTMPSSSQSRLMKVVRLLVTEEEKCVRMSGKEGYRNLCKGVGLKREKSEKERNEGTKSRKNSSKGVRFNSKESGKYDNKGTKSRKNSSKGVRLNSKESGKEGNKGTKIRTKKILRNNRTETKYKVYNVTSVIHPNNEESKNENNGVFWSNCDGSDNKNCKENESHNKETNNASSSLDVKPLYKGYKGANTKETTYKANNETLQKEYANRRDKSIQNEMPNVGVAFPLIVGVLNHNKTSKIEYPQEANKEYQYKNTGEGLLTHDKELEKKDKETVKIEQNKIITKAIKDNNGSQQTMMSTKPSDVLQTTTNQPETTIVSDTPKDVNKTNKLKMIQGIFNDITPL